MLIVKFYRTIDSIRVTKKAKQFAKLEFKRNECFSLFDSAIENLKIDINYQDKKIKNPLILFKGEIKNSGTIDIDKTSIYEPLKIITNEHYDWLEVNLIDSKLKVIANLKKVVHRNNAYLLFLLNIY